MGVKLPMAELRLWCQEGTAAGTKMDARVSPATTGTARAPNFATPIMAR